MKRIGRKAHDLLVSRIAIMTRTSQYCPDLVVGLAPDGLRAAQDLAEQLDVRRVTSMEIDQSTGAPKVLSTPMLFGPTHPWRALVVATSDDGTRLRTAEEHLKHSLALSVRTAVLLYMGAPLIHPGIDYIGERVGAANLPPTVAAGLVAA